jgi:hypothetical protein
MYFLILSVKYKTKKARHSGRSFEARKNADPESPQTNEPKLQNRISSVLDCFYSFINDFKLEIHHNNLIFNILIFQFKDK